MPGDRVDDHLPGLSMDQLTPRAGSALRSREWVDGEFVDVVAARTVVAGELRRERKRQKRKTPDRGLTSAGHRRPSFKSLSRENLGPNLLEAVHWTFRNWVR